MSEQKLRIRMGRQGKEQPLSTDVEGSTHIPESHSRVIGTLAIGSASENNTEVLSGVRSTVRLRPEATPSAGGEDKKMPGGVVIERVYPDGLRRSFVMIGNVNDRLILQEFNEDGSPGVITSIKSGLVGSGPDAEGRSWETTIPDTTDK